jgi:hypothetical protein
VDTPTADPFVVIEDSSPGYVRYRNVTTGQRWEVHGTCDRRGNCLIGAVLDLDGQEVVVRDHAHLNELTAQYGSRIDSEMDVPVTPDFVSCCGSDIFTYTELDPA